MPNIKNYIIEPTPFKLRSQSPLNDNWGEGILSNEIVNVNKKKNDEKGSTGTGGVIGMEKNPNLLTGIKFGDDLLKNAEVLDTEKEQEAKGGYNNYLRNRSQSDNARIAAKSKFKLAKREKRQGEKAIKWNKKTDALTLSTSPVAFIGAGLNMPTQQAIQKAQQLGAQAQQLGGAQQNPFTPQQQGLMGGVFNPTGNDINQFQSNQGFNKDRYDVGYGQPGNALNPNTLNEPPIPTEGETTMNDLQMGNAPMGDDFSGLDLATGAPRQGMGSTQTGGVTANATIDTRRQQNRSRRQNNRADRKTQRISNREYRRTGNRPFGG